MSTLEIVRPQGVETLSWDETNDEEVSAARARFEAEMNIGGLAYTTQSPGRARQIREFDPESQSMTITSPLVGG
jgi:hypothetical protein